MPLLVVVVVAHFPIAPVFFFFMHMLGILAIMTQQLAGNWKFVSKSMPLEERSHAPHEHKY